MNIMIMQEKQITDLKEKGDLRVVVEEELVELVVKGPRILDKEVSNK